MPRTISTTHSDFLTILQSVPAHGGQVDAEELDQIHEAQSRLRAMLQRAYPTDASLDFDTFLDHTVGRIPFQDTADAMATERYRIWRAVKADQKRLRWRILAMSILETMTEKDEIVLDCHTGEYRQLGRDFFSEVRQTCVAMYDLTEDLIVGYLHRYRTKLVSGRCFLQTKFDSAEDTYRLAIVESSGNSRLPQKQTELVLPSRPIAA
jgi:hypothetical protein